MNRLYIFAIFVLTLQLPACTPKQPPEIDAKSASLPELNAYIEANCQGDFSKHVRCLNAIDSRRSKNLAEMRNAKGSLGNIGKEARPAGK